MTDFEPIPPQPLQPHPTTPPPGPTYDEAGAAQAQAWSDAGADAALEAATRHNEQLLAELARLQEQLAAQSGAVAVDVAEEIELPDVSRGDWVRVWYVDPQLGAETLVEAFGQVLAVEELTSGPAVVVAWASGGGVSAPIPLDHRLHGPRVDAPRVELVE